MFRTRKAIVGMNRKLIEYAVLLFPMSFALCTSYGTGGVLAVKPYDPVRIIALILLGVLLWKTVQNGAVSARTSSSSICASAIIALVLTIGQPLAESDGFVFSTISFEQGIQYGLNSAVLAAIYALIFIGNFAWVWSAVSTLFFTLDNGPHGNRGDNAAIKCFAPMSKPLVALILVLCWLPYIIVWFPGAITTDQSNQLAQFFGYGGVPLTDRFPFLVGIVFSSMYKFGLLFDATGLLGIFLMTLLQIAVAVFVCVEITHWIQLLSHGRAIRILPVVFFALFPLVPTYVVSIGKDGLHAFLLALFCLQIYLYIESGCRGLPEDRICSPWAIALVAILVSLTRNNGIFLVVPPLIVLAVFARRRQVWLVTCSVLFVTLVWMRVLVPFMGVADFGSREILSLPAQIVGANLSANEEIDSDTRTVLERSYSKSLDEVGTSYSPTISDPSKSLLAVDKKGHSTTAEYCMAALRLVLDHPLTSMAAVFRTTMSMYPGTPGTYWYEDCPYFCNPRDGFSASGWCPSAEALSEKDDSAVNMGLRNMLYVLHRTFPLSILYTPGSYFVLLVILYGYVLSKRKGRLAAACSMLPLVVLEAVLFAAPCGSVRYALPLVFSLPFALLLFERASYCETEVG